MAKSTAKPKKTKAAAQQRALLDCTSLYRVYVSSKLIVNAKSGGVTLKDIVNGQPGAGELTIEASDKEQILLHVGPSPNGKDKAIYLIRVPKESQIMNPDV